MSTEVKVDSSVSTTLIPERSQVFLVGLIVFACLSLILSCYLFTLDNTAAYYFFGLACLLAGGALLGWFKSQPDVDLADSRATEVSLPNGAALTTDSRLLRSPEGLAALVQLLHETLAREPLPIADGTLDADMQLMPESSATAKSRTLEINHQVQMTTDKLIETMGLSDKTAPTLQVSEPLSSPNPP